MAEITDVYKFLSELSEEAPQIYEHRLFDGNIRKVFRNVEISIPEEKVPLIGAKMAEASKMPVQRALRQMTRESWSPLTMGALFDSILEHGNVRFPTAEAETEMRQLMASALNAETQELKQRLLAKPGGEELFKRYEKAFHSGLEQSHLGITPEMLQQAEVERLAAEPARIAAEALRTAARVAEIELTNITSSGTFNRAFIHYLSKNHPEEAARIAENSCVMRFMSEQLGIREWDGVFTPEQVKEYADIVSKAVKDHPDIVKIENSGMFSDLIRPDILKLNFQHLDVAPFNKYHYAKDLGISLETMIEKKILTPEHLKELATHDTIALDLNAEALRSLVQKGLLNVSEADKVSEMATSHLAEIAEGRVQREASREALRNLVSEGLNAESEIKIDSAEKFEQAFKTAFTKAHPQYATLADHAYAASAPTLELLYTLDNGAKPLTAGQMQTYADKVAEILTKHPELVEKLKNHVLALDTDASIAKNEFSLIDRGLLDNERALNNELRNVLQPVITKLHFDHFNLSATERYFHALNDGFSLETMLDKGLLNSGHLPELAQNATLTHSLSSDQLRPLVQKGLISITDADKASEIADVRLKAFREAEVADAARKVEQEAAGKGTAEAGADQPAGETKGVEAAKPGTGDAKGSAQGGAEAKPDATTKDKPKEAGQTETKPGTAPEGGAGNGAKAEAVGFFEKAKRIAFMKEGEAGKFVVHYPKVGLCAAVPIGLGIAYVATRKKYDGPANWQQRVQAEPEASRTVG